MSAERVPDEADWIPGDTFGARLALVRQHLGGWNVAKAARFCGLDDQTWRNWEAGVLPRDLYATAHQIALATGCDEGWLILGGHIRKDMIGPDLRLVSGEAEIAPGQLALPFPPLRLVPSE